MPGTDIGPPEDGGQVKSLADKNLFRILGEILAANSKQDLSRIGLKVEYAGGTYGQLEATIKLRVSILNPGEPGDTIEGMEFERYARSWGLAPEDLNVRFIYNGSIYKLVGAKPSKTTYPLICRREPDNKQFGFGIKTFATAKKFPK
jgi:hypothetical protein